jgi:hypothetical protein
MIMMTILDAWKWNNNCGARSIFSCPKKGKTVLIGEYAANDPVEIGTGAPDIHLDLYSTPPRSPRSHVYSSFFVNRGSFVFQL